MASIIHFQCRHCEQDLIVPPSRSERVLCPHCHKEVPVFMSDTLLNRGIVTTCASCGHDDLYIQKDFNRLMGMVIVGFGIAVSLYFFAKRQPFPAMAALGVTALIDFLAYHFVGDVTVCYACHAIYRGFAKNPGHESFDLKKLEKYGGRTPRGSA
jgi:hypothetical protein